MTLTSHSYVTMANGPSWTQQRRRLVAGGSNCTTVVPKQSQRRDAIWRKIQQSETRTLLEVLGSLRAHPNGIGRQPRVTTMTMMTSGFPSYRPDLRPPPTRPGSLTEEQTGTPCHHLVTRFNQLLARPNHHPTASGISHKLTPRRCPHLSHGVQVISQPPTCLVHQATLITGQTLPPVRTPISSPFAGHIADTPKLRRASNIQAQEETVMSPCRIESMSTHMALRTNVRL